MGKKKQKNGFYQAHGERAQSPHGVTAQVLFSSFPVEVEANG
jgi:hypothetical protein